MARRKFITDRDNVVVHVVPRPLLNSQLGRSKTQIATTDSNRSHLKPNNIEEFDSLLDLVETQGVCDCSNDHKRFDDYGSMMCPKRKQIELFDQANIEGWKNIYDKPIVVAPSHDSIIEDGVKLRLLDANLLHSRSYTDEADDLHNLKDDKFAALPPGWQEAVHVSNLIHRDPRSAIPVGWRWDETPVAGLYDEHDGTRKLPLYKLFDRPERPVKQEPVEFSDSYKLPQFGQASADDEDCTITPAEMVDIPDIYMETKVPPIWPLVKTNRYSGINFPYNTDYEYVASRYQVARQGTRDLYEDVLIYTSVAEAILDELSTNNDRKVRKRKWIPKNIVEACDPNNFRNTEEYLEIRNSVKNNFKGAYTVSTLYSPAFGALSISEREEWTHKLNLAQNIVKTQTDSITTLDYLQYLYPANNEISDIMTAYVEAQQSVQGAFVEN